MDIVSRTPFTLKLIQRFPGYKESVGSKFSMYAICTYGGWR